MGSRPLTALRPTWLGEGGRWRYQTGIEFDCPTHGAPCRIRFDFVNPADGYPSPFGRSRPLVHREGATLEHGVGREVLTLRPFEGRWSDPLEATGHWRGYVREGIVYDSGPILVPA